MAAEAASSTASAAAGGALKTKGDDAVDFAADGSVSASMPSLDHFGLRDFDDVYEPSDDTYLFLDALATDRAKLRAAKPVLAIEIGPGSGVVSTYVAQLLQPRAPFTIACEINPSACAATSRTARANGVGAAVDVVNTNLLRCLCSRLEGQIDLVLFNPPYVPTPSEEVGSSGIEAAWAGGVDGREVIDKVIPLIDKMLSPTGVMYMVVVEENKPTEIASLLAPQFTSTVSTGAHPGQQPAGNLTRCSTDCDGKTGPQRTIVDYALR